MDVILHRTHPLWDVIQDQVLQVGGLLFPCEGSQWQAAIDSGRANWVVLVDGRAAVTAADFQGLAQYLDYADSPIWLQPSQNSTGAERFVNENCPAAVSVCWNNPALYSMVCVRRSAISKIPPIRDEPSDTIWKWLVRAAGRPQDIVSACSFPVGEWSFRIESLAGHVNQPDATSGPQRPFKFSPTDMRELAARLQESMREPKEAPAQISRPESKNAAPTLIAPAWDSIPKLISQPPVPEINWLIQHIEQTKPSHFIPDSANASIADSVAIKAGLLLWHDAADASHQLSQSIEGLGKRQAGDYWHAILHRREPDYSNAKYWFRQLPLHPVMTELTPYAARALQDVKEGPAWKSRLLGKGSWDPFAFVDLCEDCSDQENSPLAWAARQIQAAEMQLLMAATYCDTSGYQ
ncbi:MAG: hypothetical protein JWN70_5005 [Planctomycetaceae bacterium]|nr:hypothetical protein [Planctomycetaceae bacterium]